MPDYFVKDGDEYKPLDDNHVVLSQDEIKSSYVPTGAVDERIETAVKSRFKNHVNIDKAHEDPTIVARVLESNGTPDEDIDKKREQWESAYLKPTQAELEDTKGKLNSLSQNLKYQKMRTVLGEHFSDTITDRIENDKPSSAEIVFGDQFEYDIDSDRLLPKGSSMSAEDFAKELAANPKYERFRREPSRGGGGPGRPGQGGKGGEAPTSYSTKDEVPNAADYIRTYGLNRAKKEGVPAYNELK